MSKKIGALWLKTMKDGTPYMSGVLEDLGGDINIAVFKNNKKEKPNHTDYQIVRSDPRPAQPVKYNDGQNQTMTEGEQINVGDIPF